MLFIPIVTNVPWMCTPGNVSGLGNKSELLVKSLYHLEHLHFLMLLHGSDLHYISQSCWWAVLGISNQNWNNFSDPAFISMPESGYMKTWQRCKLKISCKTSVLFERNNSQLLSFEGAESALWKLISRKPSNVKAVRTERQINLLKIVSKGEFSSRIALTTRCLSALWLISPSHLLQTQAACLCFVYPLASPYVPWFCCH